MTENVKDNVNTVEKLSAKKVELEKEFEELGKSRVKLTEEFTQVDNRQKEIQSQYKLVIDLLPKEK